MIFVLIITNISRLFMWMENIQSTFTIQKIIFFFSFMLNSLWFCSYSELAEAICTDKGRTVTSLCALVITVYKTRILSMVFY